jgi:flagellar motor switch protein FliM
MGELLSHSEIETLLSAGVPGPPRAERGSQSERQFAEPLNWESHNFREPEPLPRKSIELLQALHAGLCHHLARRFRSLLHAAVEIRPVGLNQMRFDECTSESAAPYLICQIESPTQSTPWLISWQTALARSLINRLLGGTMLCPSESGATAPSEIEGRLLNRCCSAVLDELGRFAETRQLGHPHEMTMVPSPIRERPELAATPYLCITFEIVCEGDRGLMHCWLPKAHLAPRQEAMHEPSSSTVGLGLLAVPTQQAKIELSADLAYLKLRVSEIADLAIGDVLMTDIAQLDGAVLRLADRMLYQVAIGTLTGKKAVRLAKPLRSIAASVSINETPTKR